MVDMCEFPFVDMNGKERNKGGKSLPFNLFFLNFLNKIMKGNNRNLCQAVCAAIYEHVPPRYRFLAVSCWCYVEL